ncbi:hypothetical protein OBBRIDRAFT_788892 [Obba rivulosa]|uniref:RRM domain-containing protein n=1 Tax=Obba rivulosa TaxID=1052685 RepID=A0A8E2DS48_9APHY|nr:hypothetical protein OBBRIDRAFT_788892 [Obba rivulosa]
MSAPAPKKAQKMSLNEFLGDSALGSWADEMDALPTAPSGRSDDARGGLGDRRRDDYMSSRSGPPREDLPLPTEPPYTAFIGNLPFDLTETELEDFFGGLATKSVKIIKDRDDRPKGFGYIEFADLDGLKEALAKGGSSLAGRSVRVSVAEPPKERSGFGGGGFDDDSKFAGPWRRDGPLPDLPSRDAPQRRFDGPPGAREPPPSSVSDNISDWRSAQPARRTTTMSPSESEGPSFKRRGPGPRDDDRSLGPADTEDRWTIGSKFKPSAAEPPASRFGGAKARGDMGPPKDASSAPEEDNWRRAGPLSRNSTSPSNSTPPTPQLARRKLELLPRSNATSAVPSPLSSPNPSAAAGARSNPFGAAKPVDVTAREQVVTERLEKEREAIHERVQHSMSRTSSRTASQRPIPRSTPPASVVGSPTSPHVEPAAALKSAGSGTAATVRPSISFASAAAGKKDAAGENAAEGEVAADVQEVMEKIEEVQI